MTKFWEFVRAYEEHIYVYWVKAAKKNEGGRNNYNGYEGGKKDTHKKLIKCYEMFGRNDFVCMRVFVCVAGLHALVHKNKRGCHAFRLVLPSLRAILRNSYICWCYACREAPPNCKNVLLIGGLRTISYHMCIYWIFYHRDNAAYLSLAINQNTFRIHCMHVHTLAHIYRTCMAWSGSFKYMYIFYI